MLAMFYSPFTNSTVSRLDLREPHPHAPLSSVSCSARYSSCTDRSGTDTIQGQLISPLHKNLQLGISPHNLSSHKRRGRALIGRDGGCSHNLFRNAPTCRSADTNLHKIYHERRGGGWNRGKPDGKKRRKSRGTKTLEGEGQDFVHTHSSTPVQVFHQPWASFTQKLNLLWPEVILFYLPDKKGKHFYPWEQCRESLWFF